MTVSFASIFLLFSFESTPGGGGGGGGGGGMFIVARGNPLPLPLNDSPAVHNNDVSIKQGLTVIITIIVHNNNNNNNARKNGLHWFKRH